MKKFLAIILLVALSLAGIPASGAKYKYQPIGVPAKAKSGLSITVDSMELIEKSGSVQLVVTYTQKNNSSTKKINEGSFKLFFTDGTSEPQYGSFGSFFPGDGSTRTYTWEWLKKKKPLLIEWEAGFFARKPTARGLKWKVEDSAARPSPSPSESATPTPTESSTPASTSTTSPAPSSPEYQPLGIEFPTSNEGLTVVVQAVSHQQEKFGPWTSVTWGFFNYTNKKIRVNGTLSLHFESGKPEALPDSFFRVIEVNGKSGSPGNWTWEFDEGRKPVYIQWNPTKRILAPTAKTLRWVVPELGKTQACWGYSGNPCTTYEY